MRVIAVEIQNGDSRQKDLQSLTIPPLVLTPRHPEREFVKSYRREHDAAPGLHCLREVLPDFKVLPADEVNACAGVEAVILSQMLCRSSASGAVCDLRA